MAKITLHFMQRYQEKLNTAIKNYVKSKNSKEVGTKIVSGTDLNNLTTIGTYYVLGTDVTSIVHRPNDIAAKILVMDSVSTASKIQVWISIESDIFVRTSSDNGETWKDWDEFSKKPYRLTQTLLAGSTSLTFTSAYITPNSIIDVYTNPNIGFTSITGNTGTCSIVFEAQDSDIAVMLEIKE